MTIRWIESDAGDALCVDDTHFPILIATWFGVGSEANVRAYYRWLDQQLARAKREKLPLINVTDAGPAGVPSADVRRLIADLTIQWEKAGADTAVVASYVIVENAIIRGVLTALSWLHGNLKAENVATCEQALSRSLAELSKRGIPAPNGLIPSKWARHSRGQKTTGSRPDLRS